MALDRDEEGRIKYQPDGETLVRFMLSDARVRVIRGPIRSGTSSMCCLEIWRRACGQAPGPDGLRRSRWFVVRNTYPDLRQSTIKTWLMWFPESDFGRFKWSMPMEHTLRMGDVHAEVVFLALDKPEDVQKLRSTEWTGGWINELEYIPKEVFDEAESRVGYYPPVKDGGPTWCGLIGDMNAPTEDNWLVRMAGEVPLPDDLPEDERAEWRWPEGWDYFVQPPGLVEKMGPDGKTVVGYELNPKAENLKWIPRVNGRPLYLETIKGKSKRWIDSRIMNRITAPVGGQPVWPAFQVETHVAVERVPYREGYALYAGVDFGRQPAWVLGQRVNDRWFVIDEFLGYDVGSTTFAPRVRRWLNEKYPGARLIAHGDPKGRDKTQNDERTAYEIYRSEGIEILPAPVKGNNIQTRLETVERVLQSAPGGQIGFMLSPNCLMLKMAMAGGYSFKEGDRVREEPDKNKYSHVADALQYLLIGAGEGRALVGRDRELVSGPQRAFAGRRSLRRVA